MALNENRSFTEKSRAATGRSRKNRGFVEISVFLPPEDFAILKERASFNDRSLSAQAREDIRYGSAMDKPEVA